MGKRRRTLGATEQNYTLRDVEEAMKDAPDTFKIPPKKKRMSLRPGDFVKLIFLARGTGERMWVEVADVSRGSSYPRDRRFVGVLANHPAIATNLDYGEIIDFGPHHVADIMGPDTKRN